MDIPNQEKQYGESFSALFTRTSFRTNSTRQKTLCFNSLATLFLSGQHQPESVPYTTVCWNVWCTVFTDKLLKTMQVETNFKRNIEGHKEAVYRLKTVCTCNVPGLWTLNIFAYEIYLRRVTFTKHDCEPLFGHGNTFYRGRPVRQIPKSVLGISGQKIQLGVGNSQWWAHHSVAAGFWFMLRILSCGEEKAWSADTNWWLFMSCTSVQAEV